MGFFKKLSEFNNTIDKIKTTKEDIKQGLDRKSWSDEDRANVKKANIWSIINLIAIIGAGVAIYFVFPMLFDFDFVSIMISLIFVLVLLGALVFSISKELAFIKEDVIGFGAKVFAYVNLAVFVIMVILNFIFVWPTIFA